MEGDYENVFLHGLEIKNTFACNLSLLPSTLVLPSTPMIERRLCSLLSNVIFTLNQWCGREWKVISHVIHVHLNFYIIYKKLRCDIG